MWHIAPAGADVTSTLTKGVDSRWIRCWAKLHRMVTAATQSHVSVIWHQLNTANYTSRCHTMGPVRLIMRSPAGFHWVHCSVGLGVNAVWGRHPLFLSKWWTGPASLVREWSCGAIVVAKLTQVTKEAWTQSGDKQIRKTCPLGACWDFKISTGICNQNRCVCIVFTLKECTALNRR